MTGVLGISHGTFGRPGVVGLSVAYTNGALFSDATYYYVAYKNTGTFANDFVVSGGNLTADILVVGGGGAGGCPLLHRHSLTMVLVAAEVLVDFYFYQREHFQAHIMLPLVMAVQLLMALPYQILQVKILLLAHLAQLSAAVAVVLRLLLVVPLLLVVLAVVVFHHLQQVQLELLDKETPVVTHVLLELCHLAVVVVAVELLVLVALEEQPVLVALSDQGHQRTHHGYLLLEQQTV